MGLSFGRSPWAAVVSGLLGSASAAAGSGSAAPEVVTTGGAGCPMPSADIVEAAAVVAPSAHAKPPPLDRRVPAHTRSAYFAVG